MSLDFRFVNKSLWKSLISVLSVQKKEKDSKNLQEPWMAETLK
jgi:hypothetical protein